MSTICIEVAGGREFTRDSDGRETGSRSFLVYDDDGEVLSSYEVLSGPGMPAAGASHPDRPDIYASSWRLSLSDSRPNAWTVVWSYSSSEFIVGDDGDSEDDTLPLGVQGYSMSVGVTIIDIWKADPTIPANKNTPAVADIGGTLVAEGGQPLSMALPTADISIRTRTTGFFSGGQYINQVGKRNTYAWQGFPAGSLLFTGMNVNHTKDGINELEYSLAYDRWYHLRQCPNRDSDGKPVIDEAEDPELDVYFKQPFEDTVSFSFLPM